MKKLLTILLSSLMVLSLAACAGDTATTTDTPDETVSTEPVVYVSTVSNNLDSMDYVVTSHNQDHEHNANFIDGLLENDKYGKYIGDIATDWSTDDGTVWTFNLREDANWVTSEGEVYDAVTAQDFVTGLQHAADFDSQTNWLVSGIINNYQAYLDGEVGFDVVGVKATDTYTVEYTLTKPVPYFYTMSTYSILFPINQEFLESKGVGCKLGEPDVENCEFGLPQPDSILYNGGYILTENTNKSVISYDKNPEYWDAENVHVDEVTLYYDEGADTYSQIKGFEQGTYVSAAIKAGWEDYADYKAKYSDNLLTPMPDRYSFTINFNVNRTNYTETGLETDAAKANTKAATQNMNFRKAFLASFDKLSYAMQSSEEDVARISMRNTYTFPYLVYTSDGTPYYELVENEFNALETGFADVSLDDGQNPFMDKDVAMGFVEAAKADGIEFPVTLDLVTDESAQIFLDRASSLKTSVETNTDGNILVNIIPLDRDTALKYTYYALFNYNDTCFDIGNRAGWGPDFVDPKTFLDTYGTNGDFTMLLGVNHYQATDEAGNVNAESDAVFEAQGLLKYQELLDAADALLDLDARYVAYAKAEAYLLSTGIMIPYSSQSLALTVSKVVPFTRPFAQAGIAMNKYKGMMLSDEIITTSEFEAARADFAANQ
jgi:ABC-type oligopeptide transport system substrate-binding subunit